MREFCHPGQEGEEETMVRALEARLAEVSEEKDPLPLVRPLLDAMDARWGAVPFDLDAGWKALEQRPVRRRRRFPLILAAVLTALCLLACGAAVVVLSRPGAADVPVQEDELYPSLEEFFRMEDAQTGLVMPSTHSPEVSAQVGSLTVRVLQTVQDTMTFYVLFSLEQVPQRTARIREAWEQGRGEDYITQVHGLKSAARWIGAAGLGEQAEALEYAAKDGRQDAVRDGTPALLAAYQALAEALAGVE